jgi:hypothetical protein
MTGWFCTIDVVAYCNPVGDSNYWMYHIPTMGRELVITLFRFFAHSMCASIVIGARRHFEKPCHEAVLPFAQ